MNETTIKQSKRLLAAGYPDVDLRMDGHSVAVTPVPLGRLWDAVHQLNTWHDFRNDLTSNELIEALVQILEEHYRNGNRKNGDRAL